MSADNDNLDQGGLGVRDPLGQAQLYMHRAAECRQIAQDSGVSKRVRESYEDLAQSYEQLADDMQAIYANRIWRQSGPQ
jgi:hypothetical protein